MRNLYKNRYFIKALHDDIVPFVRNVKEIATELLDNVFVEGSAQRILDEVKKLEDHVIVLMKTDKKRKRNGDLIIKRKAKKCPASQNL